MNQENIMHLWQPATITIISACAAMGKTPFMLSVAKNMAENHAQPVAIFSLLLSKAQLEKRLGPVDDAPIYIDDTVKTTIDDLLTKARQLVNENGVKMIIIDDLLTLVNVSPQNTASILASLKALATELNIPIIISHQLPRLAESDVPGLVSEIAGYDYIKKYVDTMAYLNRPAFYANNTTPNEQVEFFITNSKVVNPTTISFNNNGGKFN